jgi:26S proteasome regulatory subunit N1
MSAGLIGAGTNNARLAGLLRSLSGYYYKEPTLLFLVRVAQGLVHMGKGLLTMSPTNGENHLLSGANSRPLAPKGGTHSAAFVTLHCTGLQ